MNKIRLLTSVAITGLILVLVTGLAFSQTVQTNDAMGYGFTYQGTLSSGGEPYTGTCDLRFTLFDAHSGDNQICSPEAMADVGVTNGLFTVLLDFGGNCFDGSMRWMQIAVRCPSGSGTYTTLSPRQQLTPAPYALALPGLYTQQHPVSPNLIGGHNENIVGADIHGATIGGGGNANEPNIVSASYTTVSGGVWNKAEKWISTIGGGSGNMTSGEAATVSGGYLNTGEGGGSTVGGGNHNYAGGGSSTIGGGTFNSTSGDNATIGGGLFNAASGNFTSVGGGDSNTASGNNSTVGGGLGNSASGEAATLGGGSFNTGDGDNSTVGGGMNNYAYGASAVVGGGTFNSTSGDFSTIGGGLLNDTNGDFSTVSGGDSNRANGYNATVGGGYQNQASGAYATISGGHENLASGEGSTIAGGNKNTASQLDSTVGGGRNNTAEWMNSTVSGGVFNNASGDGSTVGGGWNNEASGNNAVIGGGHGNESSSYESTIGGGSFNQASGSYSTVPGGSHNIAQGWYSFAAGRNAKAYEHGCFVWGDSTNEDVICKAENQWVARSSGGVIFYSDSTMFNGVNLKPGGGSWGSVSDKNLKENFEPVDKTALLEALMEVPISTWNYTAQDESIRHIGPTAQGFYAAFGVGENDTTITTVDADGVALAAIQGLYAENQDLRAQVDDLEARLSALEDALGNEQVTHNRSTDWPISWLLGFGLITFSGVWVMRQRQGDDL